MERLTFDGNFCDIAKCQDVSGGSFCEDGYYLTEAEVQAAFKAAVEHDC